MSTQLATASAAPRVSLIASMASKYHMEPAAFQATIKATVMPSNATNEQMAAFLLVANEYDLNPITKEIYAFPAKGGGVTPVVGIDGWINLAQRRPEFDGMEHTWDHDEKGAPIACTCRIYRKDRTRPVVVTEFMDECRRNTDPWRSHPRRMLRHKATIQAIRYAFGFAGIRDEDDAEVYAGAAIVEPAAKPATVTDINARLAASVESAPQPAAPAIAHQGATDPHPTTEDESETPEWPRPDPETGELVDVRGVPWIEMAHSANRTCNDDGTWRRKRGADPERIAQLEADAVARRAPAAEPEPEPEPNSDFERIRDAIATAQSQDEIDDLWEESRQCVISHSERGALERIASERAAALQSAA